MAGQTIVFNNRIPLSDKISQCINTIHCCGGFVVKSREKDPCYIQNHWSGQPVLSNGKIANRSGKELGKQEDGSQVTLSAIREQDYLNPT